MTMLRSTARDNELPSAVVERSAKPTMDLFAEASQHQPQGEVVAQLGSKFLWNKEDPTERIMSLLAPEGAVPGASFEEIIDQLLDNDPNAAGFMRGPVRAVFVQYDESQWSRVREVCPELLLHEYRAVRFYSENYQREFNEFIRRGFRYPSNNFVENAPIPMIELLRECNWRFLRVVWWIHQALGKLARVQPPINTTYRWHKHRRWKHWHVGEIFESTCFMSTTGPNPNLELIRYGDHFGKLLLVIDLSRMCDRTHVADVSMCSKFEAEGEVLLPPWMLYVVTAIATIDDEDEQLYWQATQTVHLRCIGPQIEATHDVADDTLDCRIRLPELAYKN